MWIVKNETADAVLLTELGVEIACKDYLDLDAHGRKRAEDCPSVREAVARGALRTIRKTEPETEPAVRPPEGMADLLKDLAQNPPLGGPHPFPAPLTTSGAAQVGIRDAFRKLTQKKKPEPAEDPPATPEAAALRGELERFRRRLLADIQRLLDERLGG